MKPLFLIILIFCTLTLVGAQNIVFTDANFKAALVSSSSSGSNLIATTLWDNNDPLRPNTGSPPAWVKIDANSDGEIQVSEAQVVKSISLLNENINNLTGIEYFTNLKGFGLFQGYNTGYGITTLNAAGLENLESLSISGQNITNFNFLSSFPNIKLLGLEDITGNPTAFNWPNSIISIQYSRGSGNINISNLSNLIRLDCRWNNLTTLDTSNNPNLQMVDCSFNNITTLDFRNNPQLNELACSGNNNLTTIYLKNGTAQLFNPNATYPHIYDDWSNCPNLNFICADDNEIADIENLLVPNYNLQNITITSDCNLSNDNFKISNLKIYPNPTTNQVFFDNSANQFSTLVVYNSLGQEILIKKLDYSLEENINLNNFLAGIYLFKFINDKKSILKKIIKL